MVFAVVAVPCMVFIIYAFTPKGKRWRREQGLLWLSKRHLIFPSRRWQKPAGFILPFRHFGRWQTKNRLKIWRFRYFFVLLPLKIVNTQRNSRDMTNNKPTREELLLRLEASKERKRKRLAEMEIRARELFKERTGEEPKYVYSLWIFWMLTL